MKCQRNRQRHPVEAAWITHMGKESNNLEQVQSGLIHDPDAVISEYRDKDRFFGKNIVPAVGQIPLRELQRRSGLDRRTLQRIRARKTIPGPQNRQKLMDIAEHRLRETERELG